MYHSIDTQPEWGDKNSLLLALAQGKSRQVHGLPSSVQGKKQEIAFRVATTMMQDRIEPPAAEAAAETLSLHCDLDGVVHSCTGSLPGLLSKDAHELSGILGEAAEGLLATARTCLQQGAVLRSLLHIHNGEQVLAVTVRLTPLAGKGEFLALLEAADPGCSAEREAKDRQLRLLLQFMPLCAVVTRLEDSRLLYINPKAEEVLGLQLHQALGQEVFRYYLDPLQRQELLKRLEQEGSLEDWEVPLRLQEGREFWALVSVVPTEFEG